MRKKIPVLLFMVVVMLNSCMEAKPEFQPVTDFDLERYLGTWYEIVRMPNSFEEGLTKVTATYTLQDDGKVRVYNQGFRNSVKDGIVGKAKLNGKPNVGHLRVSFFWIFYSDYIIVELDSDYQYALVVGSSNKYLWILSRMPYLDPEITRSLIAKAKDLGFDTEKLYTVPH